MAHTWITGRVEALNAIITRDYQVRGTTGAAFGLLTDAELPPWLDEARLLAEQKTNKDQPLARPSRTRHGP